MIMITDVRTVMKLHGRITPSSMYGVKPEIVSMFFVNQNNKTIAIFFVL